MAEMTEIDKIAYAKTFIDKLANGINPLNDAPIPDDDIANNVRLSRCFFFVSDILRQVIENGGTAPRAARIKQKKSCLLTDEVRAELTPLTRPASVSEITERINSVLKAADCGRLKHRIINDWLTKAGMLETQQRSDGKMARIPTEAGLELGIVAEERKSQYGVSYVAVTYPPAVQQFILDNLDAIVELNNQ